MTAVRHAHPVDDTAQHPLLSNSQRECLALELLTGLEEQSENQLLNSQVANSSSCSKPWLLSSPLQSKKQASLETVAEFLGKYESPQD